MSAPAFLSLPNIAVRLTYYSAGQSIWHKAEEIARYFKVSLNLQGMKSLLHGRITGALSFAVFEIGCETHAASLLSIRPLGLLALALGSCLLHSLLGRYYALSQTDPYPGTISVVRLCRFCAGSPAEKTQIKPKTEVVRSTIYWVELWGVG